VTPPATPNEKHSQFVLRTYSRQEKKRSFIAKNQQTLEENTLSIDQQARDGCA